VFSALEIFFSIAKKVKNIYTFIDLVRYCSETSFTITSHDYSRAISVLQAPPMVGGAANRSPIGGSYFVLEGSWGEPAKPAPLLWGELFSRRKNFSAEGRKFDIKKILKMTIFSIIVYTFSRRYKKFSPSAGHIILFRGIFGCATRRQR